jgi:predicted ATPase
MATQKQKAIIAAPTLNKISVEGFKSLSARQDVEIRPLTILAGANSGGKSSLMQPLLLLKQTLEAPYDPGHLLLDGANVRFTSSDQFFSQTDMLKSPLKFMVGLHFGDNFIEVHVAQEKGRGAVVTKNVISYGKEAIEISAEMLPEESLKVAKRLEEMRFGRDLNAEYSGSRVQRERFFFNLIVRFNFKNKGSFEVPLLHLSTGESASPLIASVVHVPGLRGNPEREYPKTSVSETYPGTFEPYVASVVHGWQMSHDVRLKTLGKQLETLGLTWKVHAEQLNETKVELKVGRLPHARQGGARDLVSIADVGFGVSQVLPVLVALLAAKPGQVVYLEQPEIHLHPLAQKLLARMLAEAAQRGVIVIVETHSALLVQGVQTLVAKGELAPSLIKLHWFERDKDGATNVRSGDLDETGAFGDWPVDFDDVALRANSEYLDAADAKLFAGLAAE